MPGRAEKIVTLTLSPAARSMSIQSGSCLLKGMPNTLRIARSLPTARRQSPPACNERRLWNFYKTGLWLLFRPISLRLRFRGATTIQAAHALVNAGSQSPLHEAKMQRWAFVSLKAVLTAGYSAGAIVVLGVSGTGAPEPYSSIGDGTSRGENLRAFSTDLPGQARQLREGRPNNANMRYCANLNKSVFLAIYYLPILRRCDHGRYRMENCNL